MTAYYNEFDPFAAAWLRELIKDGLIADGEVDERSIADVQADDLSGFDQVHFFAGIGGWSYALRLAGVHDDEPVWTGSCPCQPFSSAGKRKGTADERHLWPEMFRLVRECRPATVFGEQVEAAIRLGWVDGVRGDLEGEGYAFGFHVLGAHSVEAPHIRQRIYWVADAEGGRYSKSEQFRTDSSQTYCERPSDVRRSSGQFVGRLANSDGGDSRAERKQCGGELRLQSDSRGSNGAAAIEERANDRLVDADGTGSQQGSSTASAARYRSSVVSADRGTDNRMEHAESNGRQQGRAEPIGRGITSGCGNGWSDFRVILCRDGKQRRIPAQPELFPLAYGVSNRVGTLRGAGNAIVPQVAAEFIKAFYETTAK